MKRRDVFRLGAAAAAVPAEMSAAAPQAAKPAWTPAALDAHQLRTITAFAGLIIPKTDSAGAVEAGVPQWIDKLLAHGDADQRERFLAALAWIDGYSLRLHRRPFAGLTNTEQIKLLDEMDHGASAEGIAGRDAFLILKGTVSRVYYATEAGFRELNKGGRVPASYGCTHPEHAR
jgi:hypothetical protein